MVVKKTPQELMALSFNVAGVVLMIVGLISLAVSAVTGLTGEREFAFARAMPSLIVSIFLIAVGVIFASVSFFLYGKKAKR